VPQGVVQGPALAEPADLHPPAFAHAQRAPLALDDHERVEEARAHRDLLVVAVADQRLARGDGEPRRRRAFHELAPEHGHGQPLELGIGGVEHHESGEERREEGGEGAGEARARGVRGAEAGPQALAVRAFGQQALQLLEERHDGVVQEDGPGGLRGGLAVRAVAQRSDLPGLVQERDRPDLREVVVVRGDPEDRNHGFPPPLFEQARRLDRGDGLVEDEQGAAEQPRLLAGDHDGRARLGQEGRSRRRRGRSPLLLLPHQGVGHGPGLPREAARALGGRRDALEVEARIAVVGSRAGLPLQVVAKEKALRLAERPIVENRRRAPGHRTGIIGNHRGKEYVAPRCAVPYTLLQPVGAVSLERVDRLTLCDRDANVRGSEGPRV
jgi:hypothetical protein